LTCIKLLTQVKNIYKHVTNRKKVIMKIVKPLCEVTFKINDES